MLRQLVPLASRTKEHKQGKQVMYAYMYITIKDNIIYHLIYISMLLLKHLLSSENAFTFAMEPPRKRRDRGETAVYIGEEGSLAHVAIGRGRIYSISIIYMLYVNRYIILYDVYENE